MWTVELREDNLFHVKENDAWRNKLRSLWRAEKFIYECEPAAEIKHLNFTATRASFSGESQRCHALKPASADL